MAWYWWTLIILGIIILLGGIMSYDPYEDEDDTSDSVNRLAALVIIDGLKYTHPEVWAKCASDIMGRPIDPPTPEQIMRWEEQKAKREAMKETGLIR